MHVNHHVKGRLKLGSAQANSSTGLFDILATERFVVTFRLTHVYRIVTMALSCTVSKTAT